MYYPEATGTILFVKNNFFYENHSWIVFSPIFCPVIFTSPFKAICDSISPEKNVEMRSKSLLGILEISFCTFPHPLTSCLHSARPLHMDGCIVWFLWKTNWDMSFMACPFGNSSSRYSRDVFWMLCLPPIHYQWKRAKVQLPLNWYVLGSLFLVLIALSNITIMYFTCVTSLALCSFVTHLIVHCHK